MLKRSKRRGGSTPRPAARATAEVRKAPRPREGTAVPPQGTKPPAKEKVIWVLTRLHPMD